MDSLVPRLELLRFNELLDFNFIGPKVDEHDVVCRHVHVLSLRSMCSFAVNPLSHREKQP